MIQAIFSSSPVRRLRGLDTSVAATQGESGLATSPTRTGFVSALKDHVDKSGGPIIFLFGVARLVVVLILLGLAIFSFVQEDVTPLSASHALSKCWGTKRKGKHRYGGASLTKRERLDLALCLTYVRHRCCF